LVYNWLEFINISNTWPASNQGNKAGLRGGKKKDVPGLKETSVACHLRHLKAALPMTPDFAEWLESTLTEGGAARASVQVGGGKKLHFQNRFDL
jgi:hypothetical protein